MTNTQAIILGVLQGVTEYLPISSSAHLVLVPHFAGWQLAPKESFIFDVLVQLGTLVGVLAYFFESICQVLRSVVYGVMIKRPLHDEHARLGWMVALATIPAAVLGIVFKEQVAIYFSSPVATCYFLIFTGVFLLIAEYWANGSKEFPSRADAMIVGCAQSIALFPGVSRSGATIVAGMACGLSRSNAARFSFLMSIPVMLGAAIIAMVDLLQDRDLVIHMASPLMLGFMSAAVSGYFVIRWFMAFLTRQPLIWFALYCFGVGVLGIFYFNNAGR